jgi:Domain of unknown function (DUF4440)
MEGDEFRRTEKRGEHMCPSGLTAFAVLFGTTVLAQNPGRTDSMLLDDSGAKLRSELETIHSKWFHAFDTGDGATMDALEIDKLVLVMPNGSIWKKSGPRAGKQPKRDVVPQQSLSDVTIRPFGDTAILTGILTNKTAKETANSGTTVVFVRRGGKWLIASVQWSPVEGGK